LRVAQVQVQNQDRIEIQAPDLSLGKHNRPAWRHQHIDVRLLVFPQHFTLSPSSRQKTYFLPAVLLGVFFVLMTVVDFTPQLLAHTKPDLGYPLTAANVTGWLFL
jgi:hypothetical protein